MTAILEKVEMEVLKLPREERAFLADRLLSSLGGEALSDIDTAWVAEAEHRYEKYKSGIRQPVSADKVFADADRMLKGMAWYSTLTLVPSFLLPSSITRNANPVLAYVSERLSKWSLAP